MDQRLYLATAADDNYAAPLAAMLASLLENVAPAFGVEIKILTSDFSPANQKRLIDSLAGYNCSCQFVAIGSEQKKFFATGLNANTHLSETAYYRLLLPELLPQIEKIIYLDCDLIVRGDISRLWQTDLEKQVIGAVPVQFLFYYDLFSEVFSLPVNHGLFNSGVMLLDLAGLRQMEFVRLAREFIVKNKNKLTIAADQDVLNAMLIGKFKKIDLSWNQTVELFVGRGYQNSAAGKYQLYSKNEFLTAQKKPLIVHFDGALKPWHHGLAHPYKKEYFLYLKKTAFKSQKKQWNFKRFLSFYGYYSLKLLPEKFFHWLWPVLNNLYKKKNFSDWK
ncbi:MAG: glycosyltransferase family 8 protein [Patescibacteria group bacterium]